MHSGLRFSVYSHNLIIGENQLVSRKFIVLKEINGSIRFTDFHRYIKPKNRTIRNISDDGNNRFDFIVKFLNYAYFYRGIKTLNELTIPIIKDFMNGYGTGTLPDDEAGRTKNTVISCFNAIMDFLEHYLNDNKQKCKFKKDDLYKYVPVRDKNGKTHNVKVPIFDVVYVNKPKDIFRDMPNDAFDMLFEHISIYHKDLLGLISLSAFAGLRPSEACNVRRVDSRLGAGIIFYEYDNEVHKVQIDLRKELCLRSDLKSTGRIKKERMQTIPLIFTDAFVNSYNNYMEYMDGKKYEAEYGAFSVNKQGKAITYDNYYQKFSKIIKEEMIPKYLNSDNPEIVMYGRLLLENNISPHIFRHWYTVQLVLAGVDNVGELMQARGDSSPESSLTYLQNKGELEKQYRKVNNEMFDYLSWVAEKKHKRGRYDGI